jgi:hypothetical protein
MVMEHAEALERIVIAAAEPEGLDRLMAGDTPDAAAVAGHLAGCPSCAAELVRIRRTATLARDVISAEPDPALRERTLAFVRAVGRDRSSTGPAELASAAAALPPSITVLPAPAGSAAGALPAASTSRPPRRGLTLLAAAAAVVIAVGIGYAAGGAAKQTDIEASAQEVAILSEAASTAIRIHAQPDAEQVQLQPTSAGDDAAGTLTFSADTGELVAVATGLEPEASNEEYGCWVEVDGQRHRLGRMYWVGHVWTWAGPVEGLDNLPAGATFGVSLNAPDAAGEPVLTGSL